MEILPDLNRSRDEVGELFGVSGRYVDEAVAVKQENPELHEKVKSGEMTLPQAKREIARERTLKTLENTKAIKAKKIEGVYDVIVIDPPWNVQKIERDCRPNQVEFGYPTMTVDELCELEIPTADDCHLWLWTTHKFLPVAFQMLTTWTFKYVCQFVWHKPGGFQPVGLPQYNCELVLYARKGTPIFKTTKSLKLCFDAKRGAHSEKPEEFYDMVRRVTAGRRLDMFNRRNINGFDGWGKESPDNE